MDAEDDGPAGGGPNYRLARNRQGYWEIRWSERVAAAPGAWRARSVSTRTTDRTDAQAFLDGWRVEREREDAERRAGTLAGIIDAYLKDADQRDVKDGQRWALRPARALLGDLTPASLTPEALAEYRDARGVKPGTLRRELGALTAALNYAVKTKRLLSVDMPYVALPPPSPPRDVWMDEAQEAEFWHLAVEKLPVGQKRLPRVTRFVALALDTAARKEAIETLTWDRVDLRAGLVDFRDPTRRVTNKRRVPVPIADRLMPVLERAKAEAEGPFVVDQGAIRSAYETWTTAVGWRWVTPHAMRHTWATLAARRGVSMWEIAGVLGDDEKTVRSHYLHHAPGHLRAAVNRTHQPAMLSGGRPGVGSAVGAAGAAAGHARTSAGMGGSFGLPVVSQDIHNAALAAAQAAVAALLSKAQDED